MYWLPFHFLTPTTRFGPGGRTKPFPREREKDVTNRKLKHTDNGGAAIRRDQLNRFVTPRSPIAHGQATGVVQRLDLRAMW